MFEELSALEPFELILLGSFLFLAVFFIIIAFCAVLSPDSGARHIHYEGEPDEHCPDCQGSGIINKGDAHFEMHCLCKMRIER